MQGFRRRWRVLVVLVVMVATAWCVVVPAAGATVGPGQIDAFLLARGSPLAGEGAAFYQAGGRAGVDPAFLVAISGAESSFGRYIFFAGSQTADYNAFNWFFATTRVGSAFTSWDQAIATVATGLSGPLYYGAGRYSVDTIAPIYCPQGTQAWINNVTAYMLALGADPNDTRWHGAAPVDASGPENSAVRIGPTGAGVALVLQRPIVLAPSSIVAGARLRICFTLTNAGLKAGAWKAVILRLEGPSGQALAFGSGLPLRLRAGASYSFKATVRLPASGVWRGWVDVEAADGAILGDTRPTLRVVVARAATERAAVPRRRPSLGRRSAT